jgi:hypothetical protein
VPGTLGLADEPPAAAVGDVAELGDVDVDQLTRSGPLIAAGRLTGDPVDVGQPVEPAPDQHRMHGRGRDPQLRPDRHRPQPLLPPHVHDLADHRLRGLGVLGATCRGSVIHPGRTLRAIPISPLVGGPPGNVEELSRPGRGPTLLYDQPRQPEAMLRGQRSVNVSHEGLLVERFLDSSTPHREAFTHLRARRTQSHNVPGHHS